MKALIAIDGSRESSNAVDLAASLDWAPGSRLEILTVAPTDVDLYGGPFAEFEDFGPMDELHRRMKSERDAILNEAVARLGRDDLDVSARSPEGGPASMIVWEADWMSADLIILGARGHGAVERVLIGSITSEAYDSALAAAREHAATVTSMACAALEATGLTASTCVREGRPAAVIVDEAATWHADLVVVGTRGRGIV